MQLSFLRGININPVLYQYPSDAPLQPEAGDVAQLVSMIALSAFSRELSDDAIASASAIIGLELQYQSASSAMQRFWNNHRGKDFDESDRAYLSYLGFEAYSQLPNRFSRNELWESISNYTSTALAREAVEAEVNRVSNGLLFILLDSFERKYGCCRRIGLA